LTKMSHIIPDKMFPFPFVRTCCWKRVPLGQRKECLMWPPWPLLAQMWNTCTRSKVTVKNLMLPSLLTGRSGLANVSLSSEPPISLNCASRLFQPSHTVQTKPPIYLIMNFVKITGPYCTCNKTLSTV